MSAWGSEEEVERRRRIHVAVWAMAYEIDHNPVVDDATFDRVARLIRPQLSTGNATLDRFFRTEFSSHTGMWVHKHPDKTGLRRILKFVRKNGYRSSGSVAMAVVSARASETVQGSLF